MPKVNKKKKARKANNQASDVAQSLSERILDEIKEFYVKENGLQDIAKAVEKDGMDEIIYPRNKVTVMIVGNHSAGKSSFINWYADEAVRTSSVAIESKGFAIVTYGKRASEPIHGEGCLKYFPHLKKLKTFGKGLMDNLIMISSVSQSKSFPMVDFIDTPGLVGAGMEYGFDVNAVIKEMAKHVDLIFVFLDPHGQALCTRTMDVVDMLNKPELGVQEKVRYYLTKVDTVSDTSDLLKVNGQVAINLVPRIQNKHGFEVPNIFLPTSDCSPEFAKLNQISTKLCVGIDREIKTKVQTNLDKLKGDSELLMGRITTVIADEEKMAAEHLSKWRKGHLFGLCAWLVVPLIAFMFTLSLIKQHLPVDIANHEHVQMLEKPATSFFQIFPDATLMHIAGGLALAFLTMLILKKLFHASAAKFTMRTKAQLKALKKSSLSLKKVIKRRDQLHNEFMESTCHME